MLGMLMASLNLTIVSPALPRIVADLGGMQYYSWIALSAALLGGRRARRRQAGRSLRAQAFYSVGLVVFMAASMLSGTAPTFWWLIGARLVQGIGMGTLMPLSQAIIGDIALAPGAEQISRAHRHRLRLRPASAARLRRLDRPDVFVALAVFH